MEYLREHKISIEKPFVQLRYVFPRETDDGYCVFRDKKTGKCLVHAVKPETCVAGPITFDINKKTTKIEWHIKMEKICPLAGVVYKDKRLLEKHLVSAKREIQRFVRDLDVEALKAILEIAEPETFKIAENNVAKNILDNLVP
jgi:Fe-S-cluster containining protein